MPRFRFRTMHRLRRFAPHVLATLFLIAGYVNVVRGVDHIGPDYRSWAFSHQAYTDLLAMSADRYAGGESPLPYVQDRVEYPVLVGIALWLPSLVSSSSLFHLTASALGLMVCLWLALSALQRIPGAKVWWLAAFPALIEYGLINFDMMAVCLLCVAAAAYVQQKPHRASTAAALGTWTKLFPIVVAPAAIADLARKKQWRDLRTAALAFVGWSVAVNLPFALANYANWRWFWQFNARREGEGIWRLWPELHWKQLNALTAVMLGVAVAYAMWCVVRAKPSAADRDSMAPFRSAVAFTIAAWILTNKAAQPQYVLYVAVGGAIAGLPIILMLPLAVAGMMDFHASFDCLTRTDPIYSALYDGYCAYWWDALYLRYATLTVITLYSGWRLWRVSNGASRVKVAGDAVDVSALNAARQE